MQKARVANGQVMINSAVTANSSNITKTTGMSLLVHSVAPRHKPSSSNQAFGFQFSCLTYFGSTSAKNMG